MVDDVADELDAAELIISPEARELHDRIALHGMPKAPRAVTRGELLHDPKVSLLPYTPRTQTP